MYGDEIWQVQLSDNLAMMGAQNWVVIAESSYPAYSGTSVDTLLATKPSDVVFEQVLNTIETEGHVQPRIMVPSELRHIDEDYAPGITAYRENIYKLLPGRFYYEVPNRIINSQITEAAKQLKILVIKTTTSLPYSNIYIELDSGYWNSDSEATLRAKLEPSDSNKQPTSIIPGFGPNSNPPDPILPATEPLPVPPQQNQTIPSVESQSTPNQQSVPSAIGSSIIVT